MNTSVFFILAKGFCDQARPIPVEYWAGPEPNASARVAELCESLGMEFQRYGLSFSSWQPITKDDSTKFRVALSELGAARDGRFGEEVVEVCRSASRQKKFLQNLDSLTPPRARASIDGRPVDERNLAVREFIAQHGKPGPDGVLTRLTAGRIAQGVGASGRAVKDSGAFRAYTEQWKKMYGNAKTSTGSARRPLVVVFGSDNNLDELTADQQEEMDQEASPDGPMVQQHNRI